MAHKTNIKKGDMVLVISGNSKSTEPARVLSIDRNKNRAIVEGRNMISVNTKPNAQYPQGGIIKKEGSIHLSNISLVDPESGTATRIGRRKDDDGKTERYSKKSGKAIK